MDATKRKHQRELDAAVAESNKISINKDKTIKVVPTQLSLSTVNVLFKSNFS